MGNTTGMISNYLFYPSVRKCSIVTKEKTYNWSDITEYENYIEQDAYYNYHNIHYFKFGKEMYGISTTAAQREIIDDNWKNCGCQLIFKAEGDDWIKFDVKKN